MSAVQVIFALCPRLICSTKKTRGNRILYTIFFKQLQYSGVFAPCYLPDIPTCATPSSQPFMTSLRPMVNLKGLFLSREESNFFPFCSVPATQLQLRPEPRLVEQGLLIKNEGCVFSTISLNAPLPRGAEAWEWEILDQSQQNYYGRGSHQDLGPLPVP